MIETAPPVGLTFTVFTPTRDRAHKLGRVYASLRAQTCRDFEWLIVDNDSSDGTAELVATWQVGADFPIRYIRHENRGVANSQNRGVREAQGELFVIVDSDDEIVPAALERLASNWLSIPLQVRDGFAGVTGLCIDEHGQLVGDRYPADPTDSNSLEMTYRYKVRGEKWGCLRTDVLRQYPLPIIEGYTGYVPDSLAWNAIAKRYRTRYFNEALRVYEQDVPDTLSRPLDPSRNALGGMLDARDMLDEHLEWARYAPLDFILRAVHYTRFSLHVGRSPGEQWRGLRRGAARVLWLVTLPAGVGMYVLDRRGLAASVRRLRRELLHG